MKSDPLIVKENIIPFQHLPLSHKLEYFREILASSLPTIASFLLPILIRFITLYYLGKYNDNELVSGYGLGSVFSGAFLLAWIQSFNQATNIFISKAFGARDSKSCGLYFRRNLIILGLILIPLEICMWTADTIMISFGVEPTLASIAGSFTRMSIPFTIGSALFDSMKSFIIGQRDFQPIFYIQVITLVLHFIWAKIFIDVMQLGIAGAAICRILEEWINALILYVYIKKSGKFTHTWGSWNQEVFKNDELWKQFKFAFNIALASFVNWLYFDLLTMIAGTFNANEVVSHIAIVQTSSINYTITLGIAVTIMVYIGNSLGEQNLAKAKNYAMAGHYLFVILAAISIFFLIVFLKPWASFWSQDADLQNYIAQTLIVFLFGCLLFDGPNNGLASVLKSTGKEKQTIGIILFSLYVISVPLIVLFAFVLDMKVFGVWLGYGIGNGILFGVYLFNVAKVDWEDAMKETAENLQLKKKLNVELDEF